MHVGFHSEHAHDATVTYRRVQRPSRELLAAMVREQGIEAAADAFDVHRETIKHWCKSDGIGLDYDAKTGTQGPVVTIRCQKVAASYSATRVRLEWDLGPSNSATRVRSLYGGTYYGGITPNGVIRTLSHRVREMTLTR